MRLHPLLLSASKRRSRKIKITNAIQRRVCLLLNLFLVNEFLFSGMEFHREIGRGYLNCPFEEKLYYIIGEFEIIWTGEMTYNERQTDIHERLWN